LKDADTFLSCLQENCLGRCRIEKSAKVFLWELIERKSCKNWDEKKWEGVKLVPYGKSPSKFKIK
jgi:hypothetical protein